MKKITSVGLATILGLVLATGSVQASVGSTTPESMPAMFAQLNAVPLSDAALEEVQGEGGPLIPIILGILNASARAGGRVLIGTLKNRKKWEAVRDFFALLKENKGEIVDYLKSIDVPNPLREVARQLDEMERWSREDPQAFFAYMRAYWSFSH